MQDVHYIHLAGNQNLYRERTYFKRGLLKVANILRLAA